MLNNNNYFLNQIHLLFITFQCKNKQSKKIYVNIYIYIYKCFTFFCIYKKLSYSSMPFFPLVFNSNNQACPFYKVALHLDDLEWTEWACLLSGQWQNTLPLKVSLRSVRFFMFLKLFPWWQSWIFSIITRIFSVTWSFRNHSNMLIWNDQL